MTGRARISASSFRAALGDWSTGPGARYQRLADAVRTAVDRGELTGNTMLPAERTIARTLWVSRGTVAAALELLRSEGVLHRRQGHGTWIAGTTDCVPLREAAAGLRARQFALDHDDDVIDLTRSVLPDGDMLRAIAPERLGRALERSLHHHGYDPQGMPALRCRLAGLFERAGLPTQPSEIVVTAGAQEAIALSARLLVQPGDVVALEDPTYPGAIDVYARAGAEFLPLRVDPGGVRLDGAAWSHRTTPSHRIATPRLVYLVPTAQNPTGITLSHHRRAEIARLVAPTNAWIVEDESLSWTTFATTAPPPIAAHTDRVLTIGSLSKVLWGGLRIGWIRSDTATAEHLSRLKASWDLGSSAAAQLVALELLTQLDALVQERRTMLTTRYQLLAGLLSDQLPGWRHRPPSGGLSVWVELPWGNADDFAVVARRGGVATLPGSSLSARDSWPRHLRLSFAERPDRLELAVSRLRAAWQRFESELEARVG